MAVALAVSKNVKAFRLKAGMSQMELARRTKLTIRYISRLENTSPNITLEVLERLAAGLGCNCTDLVFQEKGKASIKTAEVLEEVIRLLKSLRSRM